MDNNNTPELVIDDERVNEFGRYFLCIVVRTLDAVLQSDRIDADRRRLICSMFTDNLATFLDAGWIENDQEKVWPVLAFARRNPDTTESVGRMTRLFIPASESSHSEGGAEGAVTLHFDDDAEIQELLQFDAGLRGEGRSES